MLHDDAKPIILGHNFIRTFNLFWWLGPILGTLQSTRHHVLQDEIKPSKQLI